MELKDCVFKMSASKKKLHRIEAGNWGCQWKVV